MKGSLIHASQSLKKQPINSSLRLHKQRKLAKRELRLTGGSVADHPPRRIENQLQFSWCILLAKTNSKLVWLLGIWSFPDFVCETWSFARSYATYWPIFYECKCNHESTGMRCVTAHWSHFFNFCLIFGHFLFPTLLLYLIQFIQIHTGHF